jgi:hypothetical protein
VLYWNRRGKAQFRAKQEAVNMTLKEAIEVISGPGRAQDPKFKAVAHALQLLGARVAALELGSRVNVERSKGVR